MAILDALFFLISIDTYCVTLYLGLSSSYTVRCQHSTLIFNQRLQDINFITGLWGRGVGILDGFKIMFYFNHFSVISNIKSNESAFYGLMRIFCLTVHLNYIAH